MRTPQEGYIGLVVGCAQCGHGLFWAGVVQKDMSPHRIIQDMGPRDRALSVCLLTTGDERPEELSQEILRLTEARSGADVAWTDSLHGAGVLVLRPSTVWHQRSSPAPGPGADPPFEPSALRFRGNMSCTLDYIPRHVQFMCQEP